MEFLIIAVVVLVLVAAAAGVFALRRGGAPPGAAPAPGVVAEATLADRLAMARSALGGRLAGVFGRGDLDAGFWSGLEETLIQADVGVATAARVVKAVREERPAGTGEARDGLRRQLHAVFAGRDRTLRSNGKPAVVMVVGVNGTGKTTSIAKLARNLQLNGSTVLLGAADTYRAAADEQLRTWAERVGVAVVGGSAGADPASVAFDAYQAAEARGVDAVIVDTAGRLHSNRNLMAELDKVARVLRRAAGDIDEVLLVLDATTGQNGIAQAREFSEAVGVTGIILTKMDGTARGGVVAAVEHDIGVPVKFIGVGEGVDDLLPFDPDAFIDALLE